MPPAGQPDAEPAITRAEIERAIRTGPVSHLQVVADVARATVAGYEALARFGRRGPFAWFGAARSAGLADQLEAAALRAALERRDDLPVNTFLTVNVSPDLLHRPAVAAVLSDFMPLRGIVVELTEQVPIESYTELEPRLNQLRSSGAMLAIDDAGAGYAGLQHLLQLRPDIIKLDRSLVSGVHRDEAKRALIDILGGFASRIDAWVLAEGVEHPEELDVLADLGVPLAQGYLLGRPAPAFGELDQDAALRLLSHARTLASTGLRSILEPARAERDETAARHALYLSDEEFVVLVDEYGAPLATLGAGGLVETIRDTGMRVNVDTDPAQAARRAIVRDRAARFHPLVCTDNAGRYVGIVRIERLIEHLAVAHEAQHR